MDESSGGLGGGEGAVAPDGNRPCAAHVTSLEEPVYAITGLPEEVVAVVLAYVSRSPLGFRENLDRLLSEGDVASAQGDLAFGAAKERARRFHERWVVGYGHASVAEHAVVHLGVEGISRLASAELELANRFISFTEYSQRYQRPRPDGYTVPPEAEALPEAERGLYLRTLGRCYTAYEALLEGLAAERGRRVAPRPGEAEAEYRARLRRAAFEDARYALPLAWQTSLGMTANARALRDAIADLSERPYAEVRQLAGRLRRQAERLLPTLLRYAEAPLPPPAEPPPPWAGPAPVEVDLVAFPGQGEAQPEVQAVHELAWAAGASPEDGPQVVEALARRLQEAGPFAAPPAPLRRLRYAFALSLSEAAWHQLLRHRREVQFYPAPPSWRDGMTVPPAVARAGLEGTLREAAQAAAEAAEALSRRSPAVASYLVLGAHRRRVRLDLDLAEMTHLVRLRLKANAQWDIRQLVRRMALAIHQVHPFVARLWLEEELPWATGAHPDPHPVSRS